MRVVVTGGGTGGHIYPALAIAKGLQERRPESQILYVGGKGGMEEDLVPKAGLPAVFLPARGIVGKSPSQRVKGMALAARGLTRAMAILREFKPQVVVGTGGYVSGPVVLAAVLLRIPAALQEQNVVPGFTNRILSPWVGRVFLPAEEGRRHFPARARCLVTGNPLRPEILAANREDARRVLGLSPQDVFGVIFAGSRGSSTLNEIFMQALPQLLELPSLRLLWATGTQHFAAIQGRIRVAGGEKLEVKSYIDAMEIPLAAADFAITRAGATTLSELAALGVPGILIPSPYVAHNEQEGNARPLVQSGAAVMIRERELTPEKLVAEVAGLVKDPERRKAMAKAALQKARPRALDDILQEVEKLAGGQKG
ncbi:MAG: undecaprenyldiphospho-muramoylpentapeptide beta-N-acetylglucosaminyltransferase [Bacillota bacterium]|nr:undecaprenyldiphospho-muramoylpentapeptide beta-N-acetylglucosaminyltransferase [Bacillota bacterium]